MFGFYLEPLFFGSAKLLLMKQLCLALLLSLGFRLRLLSLLFGHRRFRSFVSGSSGREFFALVDIQLILHTR